MVIVEVDAWRSNHDVNICIWFKSLLDLQDVADKLGEKTIFKKGKREFFFIHNGTIYRYDG